MTSVDPQQSAAELLKNKQFMDLFEKAVMGGGGPSGGDSTESAADFLAGIPPEGDPKRDAWLKTLQKKLQAESMRAAKENLEKVQSDDKGQWMFILPTPGFCIKCAVAGGGKIFINICQHDCIAEPIPMTKGECEGMEDDEVRFRIPLSCGQARPDTDKSGRTCKAYDVIVNPATLKRCDEDHEFRRFVAALCMQWIRQKYEPTMNADEFRNLNFKAKGTLEPQRIRLNAAPKAANAMQDEIKLPGAVKTATAPTPAASTRGGTGKLIEEINGGAAPQSSSAPTADAAATVVLASEAAGKDRAACLSEDKPSVVTVSKDGVYDWTAHKKPSQNVFFRDSVPAAYAVELHIPTVQTIREVEVRVGAKKLECFYVDEADDAAGDASAADPFIAVIFDFPVSEDILNAKFVRRTHRLKLRFAVQLPDETADPRTAPERDAGEVEAEEELRAREAREVEYTRQQEQLQRQHAEEARVMAERKGYVENLSAVQSGSIPPLIRDEIDSMPNEQLPAMLHRLEARIKKGDSVDQLLDALPADVLAALIDYIREKLSLEPRARRAAEKVATASVPPQQAEHSKSIEGGDDMRVEYNYAAKSEKLFGVEFHNRYLFALDN